MGTNNPLEESPMFSRLVCFRAAFAAFLAFTTTPAVADSGVAGVSQALPNYLVVLSNGQNYTKLDPPIIGDLVLKTYLDFDTGTAGRIKSWSVWPHFATGYGIYGEVPNLQAHKVSKSYGVGSRPKSIKVKPEISVPYAKLNNLAVSMCQWKAHFLRDQGQSDKQIFSKTHTVSFKVSLAAKVDSTGAGSNQPNWEFAPTLDLEVRCMKWSGSQIPQGGGNTLSTGFHVLSATLKLEEQATANGICRLKTVTAMRGNLAGETIKYRFFHSSGKKSSVFEVKTAANKIAVVNHDWDIPNGPGPESGWLWVEGVGTKFKTDKITYGMDCKAGPPGAKTLGG